MTGRITPLIGLLAMTLAGLIGGCAADRPTQAGRVPATAPEPWQPLRTPDDSEFTQADAEGMTQAAAGPLAPVYAPLAEYIAGRYDLADRTGIGIDLGSGPGTLIIELAKRTKLHWINADINPHFFAGFFQRAQAAGVAGDVSAVFADAHALPFGDDYADVVVSRGTFPFWKDRLRAFGEIHRVLRPGGVAFVGRGLPPTMPLEQARKIRGGSSGGPPYDPAQTERELVEIMRILGVRDYHVIRPQPAGGQDVNYGIWIEWRKQPR